MKLKIKFGMLFAFQILLAIHFAYGIFTEREWKSKPVYEAVPDSLKKYDAVNVFYSNHMYIIDDDKSILKITYTIHQKTKIFSQKGIENYSKVYLPDSRFLEMIKARTIKPDGSSVELKKEDIKFSSLTGGKKTYNHEGYSRFVLPAVDIGDEVEMLFTFSIPGNSKINDLFLNTNSYTINSKLTLDYNYSIKLNTKVYNGLKPPLIKEREGGRVLTWAITNIVPIDFKKNKVPNSVFPFVRISIKKVINEQVRENITDFFSWKQYWDYCCAYSVNIGNLQDYDKNLSSFLDTLIGKEPSLLSDSTRFEKMIKAQNFINEQLELFQPKENTSVKKKLGDYIKENKLPYASVNRLYTTLLEKSNFDYWLCLGRSRFWGAIDPDFVSSTSITEIFFVFKSNERYHFIFPKNRLSVYDIGEVPSELETTKALLVSKRDGISTANLITIPESKEEDNSINRSTFAYIDTDSNKVIEQSKLLTTGDLTTVYRNIYFDLKKDSIDNSEISKSLFQSFSENMDSLRLDRNEHVFPFVFSLKFKNKKSDFYTELDENTRALQLNKIMEHFVNHQSDNETLTIPFPYSDNIKYYLIFDKTVEYMPQGNDTLNYSNNAGTCSLQISQVNPKTIYILSKMKFNNNNIETLDSKNIGLLLDKMKEAQNANLTFRVRK